MKKLKNIFLLAFPLLFAFSSCDKLSDFGDTNIDPGGVTTPIVGALLTNAQATVGGYAANTRAGLYGQYFSETQYTDASLYALPQLNYNGEYAGILMDLQDIINRNVSNNMNQVARIMQQYVFWTITDRWGDVPYSEALTGNPSPKYDSQEDIYKGMIATLKDAVSKFDNSPITGDVIYNGNVANWKRLANSLRMLMALRLSNRFPTPTGYAATEFQSAANDPAGHIVANSQNFTIRYPGGEYRNPWYNVYNGRKDFGESNTMTSLMSSLGDQRQQVFGGKTELPPPAPGWNETSNKGVPYGRTRAFTESWTGTNSDWARILRGDFRRENDPQVVIGAAHVVLAKAEAADRGWISGNVANLLKEGVELSFAQWGLAAPSSSYFAQADVAISNPTGTGANIKSIAIQRYIAFYPDGLQGWSIYRKTGFPALTPAQDAVGAYVNRYVYGANEYATNKVATEAAATAIGGDKQETRVWWDTQ